MHMHQINVEDATSHFRPLNIMFFTFQQTLSRSLKQEGERARVALKVLETMTYSCNNPNDLQHLASQIQDIVTQFRKKLPKAEGIIVRPELRKQVQKRAKQILKKYRPLCAAVKRGCHKGDWHYRNRVGFHLKKGIDIMYIQINLTTCLVKYMYYSKLTYMYIIRCFQAAEKIAKQSTQEKQKKLPKPDTQSGKRVWYCTVHIYLQACIHCCIYLP